MAFTIPDNIHPQCARLAWLIGKWQGNGHGDYPTIDSYQFGQEILFQQDGRPFIHFMSRAWVVDGEGKFVRNSAQETGFIRPQEDGSIEMLITHMTGYVEIYHGEIHPQRPSFEITTDAIARTATAKEYVAGKRLYGYVESDLLYAYDMAAMGQQMQPHIWARLQRV